MKLYCLQGACSLVDHIVLEWTGLPFEAILVPREELKTSYLEINPSGAVPALRLDDGTILTQNVAILDYLTNIAPQAALCGDGTPLARARVMRWLCFLNADVHTNFTPIFAAARFVDGENAQQNLREKAAARLRAQYELLDAQLGQNNWLVDNQRSIADPYLYVTLRWAKALKVDLSGLDNLARFFTHMGSDPGVIAALKAENLS